jgi:ClpP class serine protease
MKIPQPLLEDWAITPDAFRALQAHALMARPGEPVESCSYVETRPDLPGIAIIHVKGPLSRYASWWGGTSYGQILKDFQRCLDDASILGIAWNFDTPGGEVNACSETSDAIYAARGKKPMVAYASYQCASGGLWLASAVGEMLYCADTAIVGSIGVITYLYDDTKALLEAGLKQWEIVASQSPKKSQDPADAGYRARVQQRLDDTCEVFIGKIARNYGVSAEAVTKNFGQGDVFVGAAAVQAGLAIGLSSFEQVLANLSKKVSKLSASSTVPTVQPNLFKNMGVNMETKMLARLLGLDDSATERQIEDRAGQLAAFERSALVALKSTGHDDALGKIAAGTLAITERDAARTELKAVQKTSERDGFKSQLKDAYAESRIVLGNLPAMASMIFSEDKAAAAVAAMTKVQAPTGDSKEEKKSYKKALFSAMTSVEISAEDNRRLRGFLSMQQPQLPTAKQEPPDDKANREHVQASVSEADAIAAGLPLDRARQLAGIKSAADLPLPKAAENKGN